VEDGGSNVEFLSVRWRLRKRRRSLRCQPSVRVTSESHMSGIGQVAGSSSSGWSHKTCCTSNSSSRKCELFTLMIAYIRWQSYCYIHGVKVVSSVCASCTVCRKNTGLILSCQLKRYFFIYFFINVSIGWQYRKPTC